MRGGPLSFFGFGPPRKAYFTISGNNFRKASSFLLNCYRRLIIGFIVRFSSIFCRFFPQIFACFRRGNAIRSLGNPNSRLGELMFNPNVVLSFTRFVFCFCSLLTTIAMERLYSSRRNFLKVCSSLFTEFPEWRRQ